MILIRSLVYIIVFIFGCYVICDGLVLSTTKPKIKYRRDYIYLEEFAIYIKVNTKRKTWKEAKDYCEYEGTTLAVIRTNTEAKVIHDILKTFPENDRTVWLGIQDIVSEGEFQSIDGEPINNVFNAWDVGEPDNSGYNEDCVAFNNNGKLNDFNCDNKNPFICRIDAVKVTQNYPCGNFDKGYKRSTLENHCFKLHNEPKNWEQAFMICKAEQAELAVINSKEEANNYVNEMKRFPEKSIPYGFNTNRGIALLGFHDRLSNGHYVTIDGKPLSESGYVEWAFNQPDNFLFNEHCGCMYRDGKLNDIGCHVEAMFICETDADDQNNAVLHA